jgi:hypothetical protein
MESAKKSLTLKVKRRIPNLAEIEQAMTAAQGGNCACCGRPSRSGLKIEFSLDQVADDGCPLARAAICRSCRIAVNRIIFPSRFVLVPAVLAQVEQYLRLPWRDVRPMRGSNPAPSVTGFDVAGWLKTL